MNGRKDGLKNGRTDKTIVEALKAFFVLEKFIFRFKSSELHRITEARLTLKAKSIKRQTKNSKHVKYSTFQKVFILISFHGADFDNFILFIAAIQSPPDEDNEKDV